MKNFENYLVIVLIWMKKISQLYHNLKNKWIKRVKKMKKTFTWWFYYSTLFQFDAVGMSKKEAEENILGCIFYWVIDWCWASGFLGGRKLACYCTATPGNISLAAFTLSSQNVTQMLSHSHSQRHTTSECWLRVYSYSTQYGMVLFS